MCVASSVSAYQPQILYSKPLLHESDTTLKPLAEIHHQFRQPEQRAPFIVSLVFTALVFVPLFGFITYVPSINGLPVNISRKFISYRLSHSVVLHLLSPSLSLVYIPPCAYLLLSCKLDLAWGSPVASFRRWRRFCRWLPRLAGCPACPHLRVLVESHVLLGAVIHGPACRIGCVLWTSHAAEHSLGQHPREEGLDFLGGGFNG